MLTEDPGFFSIKVTLAVAETVRLSEVTPEYKIAEVSVIPWAFGLRNPAV